MHIVCCSLGKDSIAMLIKMLELKMPIDQVIFADVGEDAEFEETYAFLVKVEKTLGISITRVKSDRFTFDSYFYSPISRGPRKGMIRGFPPTCSPGCSYRRELKIIPMEKAYGTDNDIYIGIAVDEKNRAARKEYSTQKNRYHFPLIDLNLTEADCRRICEEHDLLHPLYQYFRRLGCWQCPKQSLKSLYTLYTRYPEKWKKLEEYQKACNWDFQPNRNVFMLSEKFKERIEL